MAIKVILNPKIEIKSRIIVLHSVISELAHGFGLSISEQETLEKGIITRQIIERINFNYINSENERVGFVSMMIDWENHFIKAQSDDGRNFNIDANKSINEQINDWYSDIVDHVNSFRDFFEVKSISITYFYREEIRSNPEYHQEARDFLGHVPSKDTWKDLKSKHLDGFDFRIEAISEKLPELKIEIEHNKER